MLKLILDGARKGGAQTELVLLKEKKIGFCDGCNKCAETKKCRIHDGMNQIYKKFFAAEIIVLGSPTYFNNVSGTMKNFLDRFSPYWEKKLKGKKAVLVIAGAAGESSIRHAENALKQFCKICGIKVLKTIKAKAEKKGDAAADKKLMQKCFETGKRLANGA